MSAAAPGWYPDPAGSDQERWWSGLSWTSSLQPGAQTTMTRIQEEPRTPSVPQWTTPPEQAPAPVLVPQQYTPSPVPFSQETERPLPREPFAPASGLPHQREGSTTSGGPPVFTGSRKWQKEFFNAANPLSKNAYTRRRYMVAVLLVGVFLILGSLVSIERPGEDWVEGEATVVSSYAETDSRRKNGRTTTTKYWTPQYEYLDAAGNARLTEGARRTSEPTVGDKVSIAYDPESPEDVIVTSGEGAPGWILTLLLGLVLTGSAVRKFLLRRRREAATS